MAVASYRDGALEEHALVVETAADLERAVQAVLAVRTPAGHPLLTLAHDGAADVLSLATDGTGALLVHLLGDDGDYRTSTGTGGAGSFAFDADGQWSQAATEDVVPLADALDALRVFLLTGSPAPSAVRFR